jgi:hypothetical protein
MAGPHAVLVEGGLAHCIHTMLTHQPLDSLVNSRKLLEAQLKLLNAVLLTVPLQVRILSCIHVHVMHVTHVTHAGMEIVD